MFCLSDKLTSLIRLGYVCWLLLLFRKDSLSQSRLMRALILPVVVALIVGGGVIVIVTVLVVVVEASSRRGRSRALA